MDELIKPGYTRVTEPLQGFSKYDMIDPDVLANAADRGTRVHKFCEMYAKGLWCVVDDDCINYVDAFKKWFDDNVREVIFTERRFYNDEYMITGQIDILAVLKDGDRSVIIDIKTTSSIGLSWSLQTAAYLFLLQGISFKSSGLTERECIKKVSNLYPIERRVAVNLPKTGSKVKVIEYTNYENDLRLYLNCLELYRYLNPPKKVKEIDFSVA